VKERRQGYDSKKCIFSNEKEKAFVLFYLELAVGHFVGIKSFLGVILSTINATLTHKYSESFL